MSCPLCPVFAASGTGAPCKCGRERERSKDTAEYAVIDSSRFRNGVTASTRGSTSPNTFIADSRRDGGRGIVRGDPDGVSSLKRRASSALVPTFAVETAKVKFQSRCTNKKDLNSQVASRRCPPLAPRRPECQSHAAPLRGARIVLRPSSATGEPSCAPFRAAGEHVSDTTLSLKPQQVLQGEILRTPSPARYLSLCLGCA